MHKNKATGLWRIIGTVYGGGYLCGKGKVSKVLGSTDGLWSSVPAQLDWVKEVMAEYNTECRDEEEDKESTKIKGKQKSKGDQKHKKKTDII